MSHKNQLSLPFPDKALIYDINGRPVKSGSQVCWALNNVLHIGIVHHTTEASITVLVGPDNKTSTTVFCNQKHHWKNRDASIQRRVLVVAPFGFGDFP